MAGNVIGFIFILILGILIGNISQTSLIKGVALFSIGIILNIFYIYIYKKTNLLSSNQTKLFFLMIFLEIIGVLIGFSGLINFDIFTFDVAIMLFLAFFIVLVFVKELIKLLSSSTKKKKHLRIFC